MFVEITMLNCTQDSSSPTLPLHQILQKEGKELHLLVLWKWEGTKNEQHTLLILLPWSQETWHLKKLEFSNRGLENGTKPFESFFTKHL